MEKMVRIAMLNTDTPVPNVYSKRGTYGNIFYKLLRAAGQRIHPQIEVQSEDFDVVLGHYPGSLSDFDAILITGSASSSYDASDWIQRLDRYIEETYENYPGIKVFGSCFGHQIVCQSLLRPYGAVVEKDPNGWELGVKDIQLRSEFFDRILLSQEQKIARPPTPEYDDSVPSKSREQLNLRLQFVHADHVKLLPTQELPADWMSIGSTKHCAVQGVYQAGRVLTYQGHFEFDRFINSETLKIFGASWEPERLQAALDAINADDDSELAAELVVRFLAGLDVQSSLKSSNNGLLTPPEEQILY